MALFPTPDMPAQRFEILSGASRQVRLRGGATVICVSGSLLVVEPPYRSELPPGRYLPPPLRLNAGESYPLAESGLLTLTAINRTQAICVDAPGMAARIWAVAARFFRAASKNNPQDSLGALHKISK